MIYTYLTCEAMKIAYKAHHGQTDKGGIPYVFHPFHLAEQMKDEQSVCVALLHDVAEDTDITLEELAKIFPEEIIAALRLLTHSKDEPYLEYVARVNNNPIAKTVKLADIKHNSDQSRMPDADEATILHFKEKYRKALEILQQGESYV